MKTRKSAEGESCRITSKRSALELPHRLFVNSERFAKQLEENPEAAASWSGKKWSNLVAARPEVADCCPWATFNGQNWALVLSYQPQFADMCDWSKLNLANWDRLLKAQPQFADRKPENMLKPKEKTPPQVTGALSYVSKEIIVTVENGKVVSMRERDTSRK